MKKLLIVFISLFLFVQLSYALNEENIKVSIYNEKQYIFKVVDLEPYYQTIKTKDNLGKELSWDLSLLDENEDYKNIDKNSLKVFVNYGDWNFVPLENNEQGKYIKDKNIYQFFAKQTGMYVIMPVIPDTSERMEFIGGKDSYIGDNKTIYTLETEEIFNNDNSLVKDGYKFIILPQKKSVEIIETNLVKKTISDMGDKYFEAQTQSGKLFFSFKVLPNSTEEIIYIYNKEVEKKEGIFKFSINSPKTKLETPKNIKINGNKISWDKVDKVNGYKVYLKKDSEEYYNNFYCSNFVCKKGEIISQEIDGNQNIETIVNFSFGDKYYIQISSYDIFGNESEKSEKILFDWITNCIDETLCRPTNWDPITEDTKNDFIIKKEITDENDILNNYFEKYKNLNSVFKQSTYKNIYLQNGNILKQELDTNQGIIFKRYYNSSTIFINSKMGIGWNHNFVAYFDYNDKKGTITVILPDGVFARFVLDKDFNYITNDNTGLKAENTLDNIKITNIFEDVYTFSKNDQRLESIKYKNYPEFYINYNDNNQIVSVNSTGSCLNELSFTYDYNNYLSYIKDNNGKKIYFDYDLKILPDDSYLFLNEVSYGEDKYISYDYNDFGLLIGDEENRYKFDNNKITDLQDKKDNKYYKIAYSGSLINIFEKDEEYKNIISEQKINIDDKGNIKNISTGSGKNEYNYNSLGFLETIKDENGSIKKIDNSLLEFKCFKGIIGDTKKIDKKILRFKIIFDNFIYKYTNGKPTEEIIKLKNEIISSVSSYLKATKDENKLFYKEKILIKSKTLSKLLKEYKNK